MEDGLLGTYVHDHLAGAAGALELLTELSEKHTEGALAKFLTSLRAEIEWERSQLEQVATGFPIPSGTPRKMAAWVAEKGLELKLAMDSGGAAGFRLFESLEALSVGIAGKRLLWLCLQEQAKANRVTTPLEYPKLISMAIRQRKTLEPFRLQAANEAFRGSAPLGKNRRR